jgi:ATP-dependent Clp protease ATP-binding subunit ClpA
MNIIEKLLEKASEEARKRNHEFVCVEHLLYVILKDAEGGKILQNCGALLPRLEKNLINFFNTKVEKVERSPNFEPSHTIGLGRVLQRTILHARYSSAREISIGDLLAAIFTESESHATYFLQIEEITRLDILESIAHDSHVTFGEFVEMQESEGGHLEYSEHSHSPLEDFTVDLIKKAERGEIDPLIGREIELQRCIEILCRRNKNNPLLVGDQGVGKTAIVEGLALKVINKSVPERLQGLKIYSLDIGSLLAGTKYRGEFEERFKGLLKELEKDENALLFIDEIHNAVGAGATSGSTIDIANLLKPVLTGGHLRCIGSTTFEEYKNNFQKDRALARRFSKIDIKEPSIDQAFSILKGLKSYYENHHKLIYSDSALKSAVELSAKYINDKFLPDKAIDVIDEVGAELSLSVERGERKNNTVSVKDVEQAVAKIAQIPPRSVSTSERDRLQELDLKLKEVVFGQDEAINALCKSIRRARAGLRQDHKPIGSFLFAGPTGVGKTEVTKQLAEVLGLQLIRFDMSEYMEKHSVARLIGAPPGYVGYDQGGLLTDAIIRNPHSVLLLDEIEKAHFDLFNILLQVMDNASLTDTTGRKADFRNVIIVMTSNVGSEGIHGNPIGFSSTTTEVGQGAIDKAFRPEFRNRLDMVVKFKPLSDEILEKVVDKFITEIDTQLVNKKVSLTLSTEARSWLAKRGFTPQFGARSIHRLIQSQVMDPLSDELLFGKLKNGGTAEINLENDKIIISCKEPEIKKTKKKKETVS